jgi:acylphosphatase
MATRRLIVTGRVQGVGYRDSLSAEAQRHGLTGWVRNRRDGSVEAVLQGTQEAIDATIAWARRGPALARVTNVRIDQAGDEPEENYSGFERWPTA